MKLLALTPMFWTRDVRRSMDYYIQVLGFKEISYVAEWAWGMVAKDDVQLSFAAPNEHEPFDTPRFTGSFYLRTENVDAWWDLLRDKAEIYYEIENFEYGMREFAIKDMDGYIIQFGQEVSGE